MSGILRYPGGKSRVAKKIIPYFPQKFKEYREPFVGGGGIYFAISPEKCDIRWINDCHSGLTDVYKAFRDRPEQFIAKCREISPMFPGDEEVSTKENGKRYNRRLGEKFQELANDWNCDQALRYFFINRTVWAGRVNYEIPSRLYYSNPTGWNIVKGTKLEDAARHIKNTKITCEDFEVLLSEPGEDVAIYCDPPYVVNTDMPETDKQYQHNFELEDHTRFFEAVKKCKHKVCISYDDDELIRRLFRDFNVHEEEWTYSGSSLAKKKSGKELIITNY